jgi:hypothetical protein
VKRRHFATTGSDDVINPLGIVGEPHGVAPELRMYFGEFASI